MAMELRCVSIDLIASCGRCSCSCKVWSVGMWLVPLALTMKMMVSETFQPLLRISFRKRSVFMVLLWICSSTIRSLEYVNCMNCILIFGLG